VSVYRIAVRRFGEVTNHRPPFQRIDFSPGAIAQITPAGTEAPSQIADIPVVDLRGGFVFFLALWICTPI